ncbi:lipopolysaccharide/colanic/teichoic acid biosynthesis glycosyltransferase [Wenyingzhuangia heitensis]|uniref:Lipopolysaccharide/colanic/teichoic acid biosynthesis glycosyltransferase n=1 Tax=Wenyingzhuangia heitensis TaxID=1487859 RepID=A0ABX0U548_9FLAO|nr:sugar transferase [Wenyingzhuangia heitensis]NIJ43883.1 lipopolysaccharide/colanic/teichoic acid biosynthesis glycosyltransferase [Wenyingzhuangia heitensis]
MFKRIFDILFSFIILITVLSWLVPIVAVLIFATTGEKPFFFQKRVGRKGKLFNIYKFRTMKGFPPVNDPLLSDEETHRITKLGKILRKYRIDEFPQFLNVLKGDMSVVGPRPERQEFLDNILKEIPTYSCLQRLRPGITSLGQIRFGYADTFAQMKIRARYDLVYLDNLSLWTDIKIILLTVLVVIKGKGK